MIVGSVALSGRKLTFTATLLSPPGHCKQKTGCRQLTRFPCQVNFVKFALHRSRQAMRYSAAALLTKRKVELWIAWSHCGFPRSQSHARKV